MPDTGPLQVVQLDDVVDTVLFFLSRPPRRGVALDLAGPERLSFAEIVGRYRAWFGWPEPRILDLAARLAALFTALAISPAGSAGGRPAPTARREIRRGATGDPHRWTALTGMSPQSLAAALAGAPGLGAGTLVRRALRAEAGGIRHLRAVLDRHRAVVARSRYADRRQSAAAGRRRHAERPAVIAGGLLDLAIGCAIAWRRTPGSASWRRSRLVFYIVAGTLIRPGLWVRAARPLLKIFPILALNLVALAILEDR